MTIEIPESHRDLLSFETKAFGFVATIAASGIPQVTPVWVDTDGEHVIFNTVVGRLKERNLRRRPVVAISIVDPENPYRYIQVRGRAELDERGADAHIDQMAKKYRGLDTYPDRKPGAQRIVVRIIPTTIQTYG
jgi:PPOX class probable F420-dependent enzyme